MMKKILFNPGPTNVADSVRQALITNDMNHREQGFTEVMRRVMDNLVTLAGGDSTYTCVPFVSSGTGVNEAILNSIHGKILALVSGRYSKRLVDIIQRLNIPSIVLVFEPFERINVEIVAQKLDKHRDITHMCFVHHETTTSILEPLAELCSLARTYGVITVVDTISSLFGHNIDLLRDQVDFCTLTSNKCLEALPGVSFVIGRIDLIQNMKNDARSYYFDIYEQWLKIHNTESPRFTMAIQLIYAIEEAIHILRQEGVIARAQRYRNLKNHLRYGLEKLGVESLSINDAHTSNILQVFKLPKGVRYNKLYENMKRFGIGIYTDQLTIEKGLFYIATMGCISKNEVDIFLVYFAKFLNEFEYCVD